MHTKLHRLGLKDEKLTQRGWGWKCEWRCLDAGSSTSGHFSFPKAILVKGHVCVLSKASFQWNHCPPGITGPLTPSALERSQKQTAQRKQAQSGAAVPGLAPRFPAGSPGCVRSALAGARHGTPQHEPPHGSGRVGNPSLRVLHGLGLRGHCSCTVQPGQNLQRGLGSSRKNVRGWAAFPCPPLDRVPGSQTRS